MAVDCKMCNDRKFTFCDRSVVVQEGKALGRYMDCPLCTDTRRTWQRIIPKGKTFLDYEDTLPVEKHDG